MSLPVGRDTCFRRALANQPGSGLDWTDPGSSPLPLRQSRGSVALGTCFVLLVLRTQPPVGLTRVRYNVGLLGERRTPPVVGKGKKIPNEQRSVYTVLTANTSSTYPFWSSVKLLCMNPDRYFILRSIHPSYLATRPYPRLYQSSTVLHFLTPPAVRN